jgi:hypothetical protein
MKFRFRRHERYHLASKSYQEKKARTSAHWPGLRGGTHWAPAVLHKNESALSIRVRKLLRRPESILYCSGS